jgi:hypothetical protein
MKINSDIVKTRIVLGRAWDMQIVELKNGPDKFKFQATYYHGADPQYWSDAEETAELAALKLDQMIDKAYGQGDTHYVKVNPHRLPVPIDGMDNAIMFTQKYSGSLCIKIQNL